MRAEPLFWEPLIVIITLPSWSESNRKWVIQLDDTNVRPLLDYFIHSFLRPLSKKEAFENFLWLEIQCSYANPQIRNATFSIQIHLLVHVTFGARFLQLSFLNVRSQIYPCCPHFGGITFDWEEKTSCDIWQHYINMVKDQGGGVVKFIKDVDLPVACWDVVVSRMSGARTSELLKTRQWYQIHLSATSKAKTDNLCYRSN